MTIRTFTAIAASIVIGALAAAPAVTGQEAGSPRDEPYPVELFAGEIFQVCESGEVVCPAISPICDDPEIAVPVDTPAGLGFRGSAPGSTLCSAASTAGIRRVFRITVR